jgi:hypothetical protein
MSLRFRLFAIGVLLLGSSPLSFAAETSESLKTLVAVGKEGTTNEAAASAWKQLVASGPEALIPTLTAFDTASPTAANWLFSAISAIVDTERKAKKPLPVAALKAFVQDTKRKPSARRIAFDLYKAESAQDAAYLLTTLINDPEPILRREAIQERLTRAGKVSPEALLKAQQELIANARDEDQVEELAKAIDAKATTKFNKTQHFNLITEWLVVGPFDNTDGTGFAKAYPPELPIDPKAEYDGKSEKVRWKALQSEDAYGGIDLNEDLGKVKFAITYAYATIVSDKEMPIQIRATSPNAVQIFLNGKAIYSRDAYHNGRAFDAHIGDGVLRAGKNEILLKICQNNQREPWAQDWSFAARVCDATGGKVPVQQIFVDPAGNSKTIPLGNLKAASPEKKEKKK